METEKQTEPHNVVDHVEQLFFSTSPASIRRPASPSAHRDRPPAEIVGEFLGDPVADAWLR